MLIGAALRHRGRGLRVLQQLRRLRSAAGRAAGRIAPINPYAASKASVERTLDGAAWRGLRAASLRYFNATGADAAAGIGEAHEPETHLLPLAVDAALGLRGSLVVHGSDYRTEDGSCVRDYVHVMDLADAHLRAAQWLMSQKGRGRHDVFNLGSGTGHSVKQVVGSIGHVVGRPVPHVYGARRPDDSPRLEGCIAKARHELGWSPVRGLQTQTKNTLRWRMSMKR